MPLAVAALVLAVVASACGGNAASPAAGASSAAAPAGSGSSLRDQMIAKAKQEGQVVLTGGDAAIIAKELNGFRQKYPFITVKPLAASPPDIVTRVTTESKAGNLSVDVLEIDNDSAEQLVRRDMLDKQDYPNVADYKLGTAPAHGLYATLGINPYFQVMYNTDAVKPADAPKTWDAMTDPKWQGKVIMARSGNSLVARLAYLWGTNGQLDWARATDFVQKIGSQKPKIASNFVAAADQVAQGEGSMLWMTPGNPPALLGVQGEAHIDAITFSQLWGGYLTLVTPKGIPHPGASWLLVDYLTSPEGQFEASDRMLSIQPLNQRAQLGSLGKWAADRGANLANTKIEPPETSSKVMTDDVLKQSADIYNKAMGIQ
ncbi:MAG TPA: extracellular solute-binding protein [Chloroflexota bacterium]|nr:extracellular solute-binding protein [Chloroflexota bacterium]